MSRNDDRRGTCDPITYKELAKAATIEREGPGARLALKWCEEIKMGGGHPEIEDCNSLGRFRVRSSPEDEWLVFHKW